MESLLQDLRSGWRMLRKNPGFAAVAILTIAIGIGANTTIFSWIHGVLINALPGAGKPDQVVALEGLTPSSEWVPTSYPDFRDFRDRAKQIDAMSVTVPMALAVGDERNIERTWGELVSGNYFDLLQVKPALGRFFSSTERGDEQNAYPVVVISHSLWTSHYHSDPSVIGRTVRINRFPYQIIGVAPEAFQGSMPGLSFEMWAPATMYGQLSSTGDWMLRDRKTRMFRVLARLAPGVTVEQARAEMNSIAGYLAKEHASTNEGMSATALALWKSHYGIQDSLLAPLGILMGASGLVLLIVCANVANLLLARAVTRRREIKIRVALGAGRARLIRQLLSESLVIATAGAVIGLLLTEWFGGSLRLMVPAASVPNLARPPIDGEVLLFTVLLAVAVTVIAGMAPAIESAWGSVNDALKDGGRTETSSAGSKRLRGVLVTSEVALALVALVGAGLFVKSFQLARAIRPGFNPQHVAISTMSLSAANYDAHDADSFCLRLRQALERQPGVTAVSYADYVPLSVSAGSWEDLQIKGYLPAPGENMKIYRNLVAPGYFNLLNIPLVEGRDFNNRDDSSSQPVMIVSQEFVRRFMRNGNPVGQQVHGWGQWFTVIGVAQDSKIYRLTESPSPFFYVPIRQIYRPEMGLKFYVRSSGPLSDAVAALRREANAIDPAVPVFDAMPLGEHIAASLFAQKISASLLGTLGSVALLLAAVGLYSVMAYSVSRRTIEIGVRVALGARPRDILRMIVRESLILALPGVGVGALLATALARVVSQSLVEVSPGDPVIYAVAVFFTLLITLCAAVGPARSAAKVDPNAALRCG